MLVAMADEVGHHLDDKWGSPSSDAEIDQEQTIGLMAIVKHIAMYHRRLVEDTTMPMMTRLMRRRISRAPTKLKRWRREMTCSTSRTLRARMDAFRLSEASQRRES